jgi:hypothetical protein
MISNNSAFSIKTFWSKPKPHSLFDEPILINGIDINKPNIYREEDLWDISNIFNGDPNWT